MGDVEAIGVILDELIVILEALAINDYEKDTIEFTINILKYIGYLAYREGIDLDMEHDIKHLFDEHSTIG